MNLYNYFASALIGTSKARNMQSLVVASKPNILSGLHELKKSQISAEIDDKEEPIFLLSAGWRAGSTMLQRLIMSDSRVLMWGEPFDECGIIQAIAGSMKAFRENWPPQEYYYDGTSPSELSGEWIANLFPSIDDLKSSQRAMLDVLFAQPARKAGAERWGIKEVRFDIEHAMYLKWLYPKARFIFLYRNPLDAYQSYSRYGRDWYNTYPDQTVFTPKAFGEHWRTLLEGFLLYFKEVNGVMIKYEDLISGGVDFKKIEKHLDIVIDQSLLKTKVGSSDRGGKKVRISRFEKYILRRAVSPLAGELGYRW